MAGTQRFRRGAGGLRVVAAARLSRRRPARRRRARRSRAPARAAQLAVGVELGPVRDVELDHRAAVVLDAALLGDRVALEPQARRMRPARDPAGRTAASSTPSDGSAAAMPEPPPNAPVTARITCHAAPLNTARAVDADRAAQRRSVAAARPRRRAYASGPEARLEGAARRAATDASPVLATSTNVRPSPSRPSSKGAARLPVDRERGGRDRVDGSPAARAKSFAVPRGDDAERDVEPAGQLGHRPDLGVLAGHHEPLRPASRRRAPGRPGS